MGFGRKDLLSKNTVVLHIYWNCNYNCAIPSRNHKKKALANAGAFFSYIRLWRVVLPHSGIMLCIVILPAALRHMLIDTSLRSSFYISNSINPTVNGKCSKCFMPVWTKPNLPYHSFSTAFSSTIPILSLLTPSVFFE